MIRVLLVLLTVALLAAGAAGGGQAAPPSRSAVDAAATFPPGPEGALLAHARKLLDHTATLLPENVGGTLSCSSCHIAAGTTPSAFPFLGTYATFPQYNKRARRFITLQDRIEECFLYSMNGKALAYSSNEMIAITAYIAWLSRGAVVGVGFPAAAMPQIAHAPAPDAANGAKLYTANCTACHGASGAGNGTAIPPLWGAKSWNTGAGMHRVDTLASFIRANMPLGAAHLSTGEAVDIAAYVLRQPRPRFHGSAPQIFQPEPARFF
jgi:thiosulfate dehydrogenase